MSHKTNPLEIPELVRLVGRYLDDSSKIIALRVSGGFHSQIAATAWETIVVDLTNNALYSELPILKNFLDRFEGGSGPRLLPWKSLESYGSHVRTITLTSVKNPCPPPPSYPRPASVRDLLTMIGELTRLQCMTLDISGVEGTDLPQLFEICSRLKFLDIRRCEMRISDISNRNGQMRASAHKSDYKLLQELSFSSNCGIDPWEFVSRSRGLRVLSIDCDPGGNHESQMMDVLANSFRTEDSMPSLQHLDLFIRSSNNDRISKVLKSVRCLRSFKCDRDDSLLLWSFSDFRSHFSTVTTIEVQCGKPEFWQKVMSSFSMLVEAKEVVLFAEDIIGGDKWASTRIESLGVNLFVRSKGNVGPSRKNQEEALFGRIANLGKLNRLSVHTGWRSNTTLNDQSWRTLFRIKTLKNVELGYELKATSDVRRRFLEMDVRLSWTKARMPLSPQQVTERRADENLLLQALGAFQAANQH